jgi:hypothetical protein
LFGLASLGVLIGPRGGIAEQSSAGIERPAFRRADARSGAVRKSWPSSDVREVDATPA